MTTLTLEEKIKQLMEAKEGDVTLDEAAIEELEEAKLKMNKDGSAEVDSDGDNDDSDEDEADDEESDDDKDETDFAKDSGKKNKTEVQEETSAPGQSVSLKQNGDQSAATANVKKSVGANKKDPAPSKLADGASADKQEDNGDNAKIQAKAGSKDTGGKVSDGATSSGVNADNAKNAVVKEHVSALFSGEELSEEFKVKAEAIFEAAVSQAAEAKIEALTEEYAQKLIELEEQQQIQIEEAVADVAETMVDQIDGFLNEAVEEWLEENRVEVEGGMKVEVVSSFIDGLKQLFQEHYVDVPDEALDVVEVQAATIEDLNQTLDEAAEANQSLVEELVSLKSQLIYEGVASSLTELQKDKFSKLAEGVEFSSEDSYTEKLEALKEAYFPNGKTVAVNEQAETPMITEEVSSNMSKYVQAIGKPVRF
jgi:hypothetical protein